MTRLRLALIPAVAALVIVATPTASRASCMQPPPIEQALKSAEIVLVGTVTATSNRDTWATISVEEIWKGPDQVASVVIKGGPGGNAATSVDRTYQVGVRYLLFPSGAPPELTDNACTWTTPWSNGLAALRPSDARTPAAAPQRNSGFDFGALLAPLGIAVLIAAVLLGVGLLARGRPSS